MQWDAIIRHPYVRATALLVAATVLVILAWLVAGPGLELQLAGYLTLHTFLETSSIVACVLVFVAAQTRVGDRRNRNLTILGAAFLGVALLDFLHAQSYFGMPAMITPSSPGKAINFWLAARLLDAGALLAVAWLSWKSTVPANRLSEWTLGAVIGVATVSWVILYRPHWLPQTFVPGQGLTAFKIVIELVVMLLCLAAALGFYRLAVAGVGRGDDARLDPLAVMSAALVMAMASAFFAIYTDVNGLFNVLGHVYKVIGAWFLYRGLTEVNLFERQTRSQLALEAADIGAWSLDLASGAVALDETAAKLWGRPAGATTTSLDINEQVHPDDRAIRGEALRHATDPRGDGAYHAEYRLRQPGGGERYVTAYGRTEFGDGQAVRIIGVVRDVTERRLAQEEMRRAQARLSGIVSIAADAIITIDADHRITMFNDGAAAHFGHRFNEVVGKPVDVLLPERFREAHKGHIQRFGAGSVVARRMGERDEIWALRKDGSEFPAEASILKLDISGERSFTVVLRDISERVQRERDLEQRVAARTSELRAAFDAIPDAVAVLEPDQKIRMVNEAALRMYRADSSDLVGSYAKDWMVSEADNQAGLKAIREWEVHGPVSSARINFRRKDGTQFAAKTYGNVIRDARGKVAARIALIHDTTDEDTRQRALEQAQKLEAIGQLAGGIAHDFNNLLTVIVGNLELMEPELQTDLARERLKQVLEATSAGANLTARLLAVSRQQPMAAQTVKIGALVVRTTDLLRRTLGEHIVLTTKLPAETWDAYTDPAQIESALLNLAINARDAMPDGGTLLIETSNVHLTGAEPTANNLKPGDYVRLAVTDTGTGMSPGVRERVFEPFFTTKEKGRGTGLGLAMIYGFAQQAGGHVMLDSELGKGTTVAVFLPRATEEVSDTKSTVEPEVNIKGAVVLLVEDDARVRELNATRLQHLGCEVIEATTGVQALELIKGGLKPDLVFSDAVMPGGVSGPALYEQAKVLVPRLKFLLTSGYSEDVFDPNGVSNLPFKVLRKPYRLAELAAAIREALR